MKVEVEEIKRKYRGMKEEMDEKKESPKKKNESCSLNSKRRRMERVMDECEDGLKKFAQRRRKEEEEKEAFIGALRVRALFLIIKLIE